MIDMFDETTLSLIREYAEKLASPTEIALLLWIDENQLIAEINTPDSPVRKAYYAGKLKTVLSLREQEILLAAGGSPQAVERTIEYVNSMNDDEIL